MQNYRVGQILFLIANENVIPVQVIEEVVRTTLEGKEKTYIVKFPDKDQTKSDISKIKGPLFTSKEEVRVYMITNATNAIDKMLKKASEIMDVVFGDENALEENIVDNSNQKMQNEENNNIIKVDLGNGAVGKINTSNLENIGEAT